MSIPSKTKPSNKKPTNKLSYYIMAPFRALSRARYMYEKSFSNGGGRFDRGRVMGAPAGIVSAMPRSQSQGFYKRGNASGDDMNELIRAASQGSLGTLSSAVRYRDAAGVVPRSQSVAVGAVGGIGIVRIDEDEEFDGDVKGGADMMYPRSRSSAVVEKRRTGVLA